MFIYVKFIIYFLTFISFETSFAQTKQPLILKTQRFAGEYQYGKDIEKGEVGYLTIYPESDTTILFYIDLNRGAPNYNMGQLYGRIIVKSNKAIFTSPDSIGDKGCQWSMTFNKSQVVIETINDQEQCGFGFGVLADGIFLKKSSKSPLFFIDATGAKVYFSKTKPEGWNK